MHFLLHFNLYFATIRECGHFTLKRITVVRIHINACNMESYLLAAFVTVRMVLNSSWTIEHWLEEWMIHALKISCFCCWCTAVSSAMRCTVTWQYRIQCWQSLKATYRQIYCVLHDSMRSMRHTIDLILHWCVARKHVGGESCLTGVYPAQRKERSDIR